jgi:hypothetical protein
MKNYYTLTSAVLAFFAILLTALPGKAQIPIDSPIPVDFFVEVPATGFSRQYDYGSVSNSVEWGVQPVRETVSGEVVWVRDDGMAGVGPDSLGCEASTVSDYTGKIALVRRGACFFSDKAYYAVQAGAIGVIVVNNAAGLINMAAGDEKALAVDVPIVSIDIEDGAQFIPLLDAGQTVIATFQVRSFFGAIGPYAYSTPLSQIIPLDAIQVDLLNLDSANPLESVSAQVDIMAPSGATTTLEATADVIAPNETFTYEFADYLPAEAGIYQMVFTNSNSEDTLRRSFEISDYTFQMDNGNIPEWPVDSWIAPTDETFLNNFLVYEFGNLYRTGENAGVATHASFSIGNPDVLFTGDQSADVFYLTLFDTDPNNTGQEPDGGTDSYAGFQVVGTAPYILTGEEQPYDILIAEFPEPVNLKPNGYYLLMAQYDGVNAALGTPPWYTYAGLEPYPGISSVVFTSRLFMGGWAGGYRAVVRLYTAGFTPVSTKFTPLSPGQAHLMPNPAKDYISLQLELDNVADQMQVRIVDLTGRVFLRQAFDKVQNDIFTFDTSSFPAGAYFMVINTPQGYQAKKFLLSR